MSATYSMALGWRRLVLVLLPLALLAPTAGDIGGCGQEPALLDAQKFFEQKQLIDCSQCVQCAIPTSACDIVCGTVVQDAAFPRGCFPLVHDGEVCLNALLAADCDDYASFMDDVAPTAPSECNFCPLDEQPLGGGAP